jgi:beta-lactam-binding protein with PASTA domain
VTGLDQATAEGNLVAANLTSTTTTAYDATVLAGIVISQNPLACTDCARPGHPVGIVVSLGPAGSEGQAIFGVPNVVGQTQAKAEALIVSVGLTVGTVLTANSDTVPNGTVISQFPSACNECVRPGSSVSLTVSLGSAAIATSDSGGGSAVDILILGLLVGFARRRRKKSRMTT